LLLKCTFFTIGVGFSMLYSHCVVYIVYILSCKFYLVIHVFCCICKVLIKIIQYFFWFICGVLFFTKLVINNLNKRICFKTVYCVFLSLNFLQLYGKKLKINWWSVIKHSSIIFKYLINIINLILAIAIKASSR